MSKAVLLSIRPEWCSRIFSGWKTVEIRKTRPASLKEPFKCYIYCTKGTKFFCWKAVDHLYFDDRSHNLFDRRVDGMVVGTFVCDRIDRLAHVGTMGSNEPAKLYIETPDLQYEYPDELLRAACLSEADVEGYLKGRDGLAWHISDLKIYDQPRELRPFTGLLNTRFGVRPVEVQRPPQSWCYVRELEEVRNEQEGE